MVGTGLGTIFRYFSYKKWVFLAAVAERTAATTANAAAGIVAPAETEAAAAAARGRSSWPDLTEHGPIRA